MTAEGIVGDDYRAGLEGHGWTGVTEEDKRNAGGQANPGDPPHWRAYTAVVNAECVRRLHGSGYWTAASYDDWRARNSG